jgi:NAD(P)-dependent dehydrogenase (short-subunit alcohol dehydrogenase family)
MVDEATARALFAVHALFPMMFLGWMARRANHAEGASAVLVSSRSAREADVGNAAYAAAKGAVEGLYATARAELARRGVRVELYAPSEVDTPMARGTWMASASPERMAEIMARHPGGRLPTADEAAAEIVALLDGKEGR